MTSVFRTVENTSTGSAILRLFDAGRTARTGADPNLIVGGAGVLDNEGAAVLPAIMPPNVVGMMSPSLIGVVGAAPAAGFGAVELLTEEAAVGGVGMLALLLQLALSAWNR